MIYLVSQYLIMIHILYLVSVYIFFNIIELLLCSPTSSDTSRRVSLVSKDYAGYFLFPRPSLHLILGGKGRDHERYFKVMTFKCYRLCSGQASSLRVEKREEIRTRTGCLRGAGHPYNRLLLH